MSRRSGMQPHLALLIVQIMFGTWPIAGKIALRSLPSTGLVALRVAGAALAFAVIHRLTKGTPLIDRGDYGRLVFYSLLGIVINQLLFVRGLAMSTAINATLLGTAIPISTLLVSVLIGQEKFSFRVLFGITLAASGVVYLVDPWRADLIGDRTFGNLLLIANTVAYGAYIALSQDVVRRYGALTVITWIFAIGCIGTVPIGGYQLAQASLGQTSPELWLAVLYIIFVPTVGAYYLNAWALARVAPSTVAVYIYLQPLIAFFLAPLILGADERWDLRTIGASVLIFLGVAVVTWRTKKSRALEEISERPDSLGP